MATTARQKSRLQDWVFHYNIYTSKWEAAKRDNYNKLFSDRNNSDVLKSSNINTLVELIERTDGDEDLIKKLTK